MARSGSTSLVSKTLSANNSLEDEMDKLANQFEAKGHDLRTLHIVYFPGKTFSKQVFGHIGIFHNDKYLSFSKDSVTGCFRNLGFTLSAVLEEEAKNYGKPIVITLSNQAIPDFDSDKWKSEIYNVLTCNCVHAAVAYLSAISPELANALQKNIENEAKEQKNEMGLRPFTLAERIAAYIYESRNKAILEDARSRLSKIQLLIQSERERLDLEFRISAPSLASQAQNKVFDSLDKKHDKMTTLTDLEKKFTPVELYKTILTIGGRTAAGLAKCIPLLRKTNSKRIFLIQLYGALQDPSLGNPAGIKKLRDILENKYNKARLLDRDFDFTAPIFQEVMAILQTKVNTPRSDRKPEIAKFYDDWLTAGKKYSSESKASVQSQNNNRASPS